MPKVIFLGTGTSTGVPQIGCTCRVCTSDDGRDRRLRTSAMVVNDDGRRLLIDCGPDFREQMLRVPFARLDAVLITHEHYDHVGGLDDLRPFCKFGEMDVYGDSTVVRHLRERMPYCFVEHKYPGVPNIVLHQTGPADRLDLAGFPVTPIQVIHGCMPILGYRIGSFVYITDMSRISDEEKEKVKGAKVLVINALRLTEHASHQSLREALDFVSEVVPAEAYLVHMSHQMGLHAEVEATLPVHVHLAYDGLTASW